MMQGMTPERWQQLQVWLDEALELEQSSRDPYIRRVCKHDQELELQLRLLIEAAEAPEQSFLDRPLTVLGEGNIRRNEPVPERLGAYHLLGPLGSGGMGDVFLARRADAAYEQRVAIKILRREMASQEMVLRFRHERQILASLDHPGIARLLDGGTTPNGRPYLIMEYVEGLAIDVYCQRHQLGVEARLELFQQVLKAVRRAHQNLVVHRDLKPSNILITSEKLPKLLDFGIAKLLDPGALDLEGGYRAPATREGLQPMTLEYASPEQLSGASLTTASDVYALGVLLHELLTGRRPYAVSRDDPRSAMRRICEQPVRRPSHVIHLEASEAPEIGSPPDDNRQRLERRLAGDLDQIVATAMAKEAGERYASVEQLLTDLERHRLGQPISARPHTWTYRSAKFVGRHRLAVSSTAAVFAVLVGLLIALWWQRGESRRQEQRATQVSSFLIGLFSAPDPDVSRGRSVTVEEMLESGVRQIGDELHGDPELRSALLETMGTSFLHLGRFERAHALLEQSLEARRDLHGEQHPTYADGLLALAELRSWQGRYAEGRQLASRGHGILANRLGPEHSRTQSAFVRLARMHHLEGNLDAAEAGYRLALRAARADGHAGRLAVVLERFAELLTLKAQYGEAEAMYREALRFADSHHGRPHRLVAQLLSGYGVLLEARGDYETAEQTLLEAERMQLQLFNDAHPDLATTRHNLASLLERLGHGDQALELFEKSLEQRRELLGPKHPRVASTLSRVAKLRQERGDLEGAERGFRDALRIRRESFGALHPETAMSLRHLGQLKVGQRQLDAADQFFEQALAIQRDVLGPRHREVAATLNNQAVAAVFAGDLERASRLYRQSLEIMEQALGPLHDDVANARYNLAAVYHRQGEHGLAEQGYRQALEAVRQTLGADHRKVGRFLSSLASLQLARQAFADAEQSSRQAAELLGREAKDSDLWLLSALRTRGRSLLALGRLDEAEPVLRRRLDLLSSAGSELADKQQQARQDLDRLDELRQVSPTMDETATAEVGTRKSLTRKHSML